MIKRIWKDPVGSKVIAVAIVGILSLAYAQIKSSIDEITFLEAYQSIFDLRIRLVYVVVGIILFFILRVIFSKKKSYYSRKQQKLRKMNHSTDPKTDILYRWSVYFDFGTPYIGNLTAFCTKHDGPPIRFVNNRCPLQDCTNSYQFIDTDMVQNLIESGLIDSWEKMK